MKYSEKTLRHIGAAIVVFAVRSASAQVASDVSTKRCTVEMSLEKEQETLPTVSTSTLTLTPLLSYVVSRSASCSADVLSIDLGEFPYIKLTDYSIYNADLSNDHSPALTLFRDQGEVPQWALNFRYREKRIPGPVVIEGLGAKASLQLDRKHVVAQFRDGSSVRFVLASISPSDRSYMVVYSYTFSHSVPVSIAVAPDIHGRTFIITTAFKRREEKLVHVRSFKVNL